MSGEIRAVMQPKCSCGASFLIQSFPFNVPQVGYWTASCGRKIRKVDYETVSDTGCGYKPNTDKLDAQPSSGPPPAGTASSM